MASAFDRWEKDPYFSAAEEVQESADRMESNYRTWIHAKNDTSGLWNSDEVRRDLQTTLGTTKWQLDEFQRAVRTSYTSSSSADDAKDRHREFIIAIENQISKVESSLNESTVSTGKPPLPWVRLDEGECDELALFLSGQSSFATKNSNRVSSNNQGVENMGDVDQQSTTECSKNSSPLVELGRVHTKDEKLPGHRRTASASAEIGSWNISVADDALSPNSSGVRPDPPPRKIPSFSGFLNTMESSMSQLKWSKNGYKKLKLIDHHQEAETTLPRSQNLTRGVNICYEKSKSCLDSCDDCYDKQLYSWYGAIQRQLQRSQYQMQYSRPVQVVLSFVLLLGLLASMKAERAVSSSFNFRFCLLFVQSEEDTVPSSLIIKLLKVKTLERVVRCGNQQSPPKSSLILPSFVVDGGRGFTWPASGVSNHVSATMLMVMFGIAIGAPIIEIMRDT